MRAEPRTVRVCLVAIPEVMASTLMGLYDVLNSFNLLGTYSDDLTGRARFKAEIVAMSAGSLSSASGVPVEAKRSIKQIASADVVIIPSVLVEMGYLSNREDEAALKKDAYRGRLMTSVVRALDQYFDQVQIAKRT